MFLLSVVGGVLVRHFVCPFLWDLIYSVVFFIIGSGSSNDLVMAYVFSVFWFIVLFNLYALSFWCLFDFHY